MNSEAGKPITGFTMVMHFLKKFHETGTRSSLFHARVVACGVYATRWPLRRALLPLFFSPSLLFLSLSSVFSSVDDLELRWPPWPSEGPRIPSVATNGISTTSTPLSFSSSLFPSSPVHLVIFLSVYASLIDWNGVQYHFRNP